MTDQQSAPERSIILPVSYDPLRWMIVDANGGYVATTRDHGPEIAWAINGIAEANDLRDTCERHAAECQATAVRLEAELEATPSEIASSGWIDVRERTPEMNWVQVLAYSPAISQDGEQIWMCLSDAFRSSYWLKKYNVTHWMALPAAPTKEQSER